MSWHFLAKPVPSRPFPVGTTGRQGRDDYPISRPVSRRDRDSRRGGPGPWGSLGNIVYPRQFLSVYNATKLLYLLRVRIVTRRSHPSRCSGHLAYSEVAHAQCDNK